MTILILVPYLVKNCLKYTNLIRQVLSCKNRTDPEFDLIIALIAFREASLIVGTNLLGIFDCPSVQFEGPT